MPTNSNVDKKETQKMYDKEVARFAKRIAVAYSSDKIRLVTSRNVRRAVLLHDIDAINDVIRDIPNMPDGFRSDFCDAFIGEDMSGLDLATPAILGYAYRAISARVQNGDKSQQGRLNKLAARIDDLSADFANSGGMVVRQNEWPLINMSNIANENEDFAIMLDARMADVAGEKKEEIKANSDYAKKIAKDYDEAWNLNKLKPTDVDKLSERWNKIYKFLDRSGIHDDTREKFIKCKMLDSKGRVIPQFSDKDGTEHEEYEKGFEFSEDSRYEAIIELVKHDIAKRYVADVNAKIDAKAIEDEFNAELLIKLYEIYVADQIAQGAAETPEQFADQEFRESFEKMLEPDGDGVTISDNGYNVAIETQTDATVGWFARLRNKVGGNGKNLKKLWKEVNRSLEYVDDMADVRMSRAAVERRKKRREFAGRIITGFGSSFIASALITVGATAAAAKAGKSLAWGSAFVGGGLALGMVAFQVARWRRNQKKNNLPVSWEEFKKNKQLVRSLITSGLAIVAMVLSALGLAGVAMAVGIGAVALGAYNNGRRILQSAQDSGMSKRQKIAWTIASVASVIVGALGGRMGAQWGIEQYNELNPDNTLFQNKEMIPGEPKKVSDEITHERTVRHYPDEMLQSAKSAVEGWYAHDYPNHPEILQQDIDAVNQYNADHDTNLDPYRILRAMKTSQPSRLVYTEGWTNAHNISQETIAQAANAVGGGTYNSAGMESARLIDANMGTQGEVGPVGDFTNKTYSPITELPTDTTETVIDQVAKYKPTYDVKIEPVDVRAGYGAFGNYPRRDSAPVKTAGGDKFALFLDRVRDKRLDKKNNLRDRVGSFLDRVRGNRRNEPVTEEVPPVIDNEEEKIPTFTLDEPQEQQLPPVILDERDEEFRTTGENTNSPARRKEYVPPVVNLSQPQRVPDLRLKDMPVALPDPESRKYEPYYDFALTEAQAERLNNLHTQLATIRAKMKSQPMRADKYVKLRKQAYRLIDEINSFAFAPDTKNKIAQKQREISQREADRQQPQRVFEMPMPEQSKEQQPLEPEQKERDTNALSEQSEYKHQKKDFENRYPRDKRLNIYNRTMPQPMLKSLMAQDLVSRELMKIRGVPVKVLDLDGHNNPITQKNGRAMVVVDIDGLRIPFYLANGNEPSGLEIPGKWYPIFSLTCDSQWVFGRMTEYLNDGSEGMGFVKAIAEMLNVRIGDIRNYIDNVATQVEPSRIYTLVDHTPNNISHYMIWTSNVSSGVLNAYIPWLRGYFNNIQAPDYDEFAAKQQQRQAKREGRRELRQERIADLKQKFGLGAGGLLNRVRGQFFGSNDDPNEHK